MEVELKMKLKDLLSEKKMTQKGLAEITKIRESTISDIIRGNRTVLNFNHISRIASALEIEDIRELMEFIVIEK
ncbi:MULTISPECIES: helix-turn-helix domain-containing protein [Staphylococcus]|uniref:helix-turn-helix domain-containing protein n=1 Tax=Staphylococcus TaxID=1279 RepID=UPI000E044B47|nr:MULTISPECIES: helix-turn-helix transcriptional regulator [Staphylococcus]MCI2788743.1 helix-turn-helix transcriptional regulator [Staphylococcus warneri]MEB8097754.1 helix-turn-helix transcriptional regulator [Staphylococcus xylosus]QQT23347.1 helix-turn-helix transcriptional regulator [Staphylococcus equorum]RTX76992.1 XRE family transcriptional regulator [Staphylococcus equorum subsp. equorum]SUM25386.1 Predicted transcriptional regulator [Staphylococcus equorum]